MHSALELAHVLCCSPLSQTATTIDWRAPSLARSTLTHDQMINWTKAKGTCVLKFRVMQGKMLDHSEANRRWENQVEEFRQTNSFRELRGIDGKSIEFDWNISQDLRHWRFSRRSRKTCKIETLSLKIMEIESSSCQCSMILNGREDEIQNNVFSNSEQVKSHAKNSREDTRLSSSLETKRNGMELSVIQLKEIEIPQPHRWWNNSKKPVTQYSTTISALSRGILKRITETPYTSMLMLRTQNSSFERITQQIGSVPTEQSQAV